MPKNVRTQHHKTSDITPVKHTRLGIASLVLSIIAGVFLYLLFVFYFELLKTYPDGFKESPIALLVGFFAYIVLGLSFVSFFLGMAGTQQKNIKTFFANIGIIISTILIIMTIFQFLYEMTSLLDIYLGIKMKN